jgi:hypothetical protein
LILSSKIEILENLKERKHPRIRDTRHNSLISIFLAYVYTKVRKTFYANKTCSCFFMIVSRCHQFVLPLEFQLHNRCLEESSFFILFKFNQNYYYYYYYYYYFVAFYNLTNISQFISSALTLLAAS